MRIISGKFRGKRIHPPSNIKVRPTTDFAKEGLFNVLNNYDCLTDAFFLDLYSGTGNISYELFSRGASHGDSVDISLASFKFRKKMVEQLDIDLQCYKLDCKRYIRTCKKKYSLIFCDPPYDSPDIAQLPSLIFGKDLLLTEGILIIEHPREVSFVKESNFVDHRIYGKVNFSIFRNSNKTEEEE